MNDPTSGIQELQDIYDNAFVPKDKYRVTYDDTGSLDVGSFIAGEDFCFEDEQLRRSQQPAMSAILDISVPWKNREDTYMIKRHRKVYDLVAQCDSEDRPIQIVGAYARKFPELKKTLTLFIVIKDYNDPIFPSIWGGLKDNACTNTFINVIADYFIGTHSQGNGDKRSIENAEQYFPDHEDLVIFGDGDTITSNNAQYIKD